MTIPLSVFSESHEAALPEKRETIDRKKGALKVDTLQCILVVTILLRTYDDHEAAGLV
jgi:hypothetical protein